MVSWTQVFFSGTLLAITDSVSEDDEIAYVEAEVVAEWGTLDAPEDCFDIPNNE